jgi:hypothetical protein
MLAHRFVAALLTGACLGRGCVQVAVKEGHLSRFQSLSKRAAAEMKYHLRVIMTMVGTPD